MESFNQIGVFWMVQSGYKKTMIITAQTVNKITTSTW